METSTFEQVKEFHDVFGHANPGALAEPDADSIKLRLKLILEEFIELVEATTADTMASFSVKTLLGEADDFIDRLSDVDIDINHVEIADALGDIKYVTDGAAIVYGIPLDKVSAEIHRSNMSKLGADGQPLYREDGKVLKGPDYTPPDIASILG